MVIFFKLLIFYLPDEALCRTNSLRFNKPVELSKAPPRYKKMEQKLNIFSRFSNINHQTLKRDTSAMREKKEIEIICKLQMKSLATKNDLLL